MTTAVMPVGLNRRFLAPGKLLIYKPGRSAISFATEDTLVGGTSLSTCRAKEKCLAWLQRERSLLAHLPHLLHNSIDASLRYMGRGISFLLRWSLDGCHSCFRACSVCQHCVWGVSRAATAPNNPGEAQGTRRHCDRETTITEHACAAGVAHV